MRLNFTAVSLIFADDCRKKFKTQKPSCFSSLHYQKLHRNYEHSSKINISHVFVL